MPQLVKYRVALAPEVRSELEAVTRKPSASTAQVRRATILLMADEGHSDGRRPDREIAEKVGLSERQIVRIRQKFVKSGPEPTLTRAPRCDAGVPRTIDGRAEAQLIVIACSPPPEGRDHWTLQLVRDEMLRLNVVKSVCCETIRRTLKKTNCVPG